jgi:hypothetical protein
MPKSHQAYAPKFDRARRWLTVTSGPMTKCHVASVSRTAKRAKLAECLAFLCEADVLTVTKPDRLARSTAELLSIERNCRSAASAWWFCPWAASGWTTAIPPASSC